MYASGNPRTKKQLKKWLEEGKAVRAFQPGSSLTNFEEPKDGWVSLEGPHYPQPHRWYTRARLENGIIKELR